MLFFLSATLMATALANPILPQSQAASVSQADTTYLNAVDLSQVATASQFSCLKKGGYTVAFLRGYNSAGSGSFDSNVITNIKNANSGQVGTEVYMSPQPNSNKNGTQQVDELYNNLKKNGITVRTLWLQVVSPFDWPSAFYPNINFIKAIFNRFRYYGITPGLYTSAHDWMLITDNFADYGSDVMLWYYAVYGPGMSGESKPDYSDFYSFAGFKHPVAKQYGQNETVCSISPVNRDVFTNSNLKMSAEASSQGPIVGGYVH